jgi:hypothetical protein
MKSVFRRAIVSLGTLAYICLPAANAATAPRTPAQIAAACGLCFVSSVTGTIRLSAIFGDRNPFGPVRRVNVTLARAQDLRIFVRLAARHGVIPDGGIYESGNPYWFRAQDATVIKWSVEASGPDKGDAHVSLHVSRWTALPQ